MRHDTAECSASQELVAGTDTDLININDALVQPDWKNRIAQQKLGLANRFAGTPATSSG